MHKEITHTFSDIIKDFGSLHFFYPVFEIQEQRARIGQVKGIFFEIRTKEQGHNVPHLHANYGNQNISISLIDFSILAGNLPHKQEQIAIEWTKNNIDKLKNKWLEYHKYFIPVM